MSPSTVCLNTRYSSVFVNQMNPAGANRHLRRGEKGTGVRFLSLPSALMCS